jgi:heat shock protein HslJ
MNKPTILLLIVVIAAVMIAGCTTPQPEPQPVPAIVPPTAVVTTPAPPTVPAQLTGTWIVTKMAIRDGTAITYPTTRITLKISTDGTVSGNSGCNNYNGPFTLIGETTPKGKGISIGPLTSTKMFCQAYANQETMYLNILEKAVAYNGDGNQLSITATTGDVLIYQVPA